MTLGSPLYLLVLIPALVVLWLLAHGKLGRDATLVFSYLNLLKQGRLKRRTFESFNIFRFLGRFLPIFLFIFALSRPQKTTVELRPVGETTEFVFAIDDSASMLNSNFGGQNRLDAVRLALREFIGRRTYDRLGLVAFAQTATTLCPVTADHPAFLEQLEQLREVSLPNGRVHGVGVATALNRLKDSSARYRAVILISDGAPTPGTIDTDSAALTANALGIHVYAIGIGAEGQGILPESEPVYGQDKSGKQPSFDERALFLMARKTGGVYFRAKDPKALSDILHEIDSLEQYQLSTEHIVHHREYFMWLAWPGLICLIVNMLFDRILFKKLP
jgi:Ca-activated chloride channel family protein